MLLMKTVCFLLCPLAALGHFTKFGESITGPLVGQELDVPSKFGSNAVVSDDGKLLVVGASHSLSDISKGTNPDFGAVFVYARTTSNDSAWTLSQALYGDETGSTGPLLSLSPDGAWLTVQRDGSLIEVYETQSLVKATTITSECVPNTIVQSNQWLTVGCDTFDNDRGKVHIYKHHIGQWQSWAQLFGAEQGDRFGFAVGSDARFTYYSLRLAVSSPNASNLKGSIRLYEIFSAKKDSYQPVGRELSGQAEGAQLGVSVAFSNSVLVVGSPSAGNNSGILSMHVLQEDRSWENRGEIQGTPGGGLGYTVTISSDGYRIAASSQYSSQVQIYERTNTMTYDIIDSLSLNNGVPGVSANFMNGPGSLLVISSPGVVDMYLDQAPFCGTHVSSDGYDSFVLRQVCRSGNGDVISARFECLLTLGSVGTTFDLCKWNELQVTVPSHSPTIAPIRVTKTPSITPATGPSRVPTLTPTMDDTPGRTMMPSSPITTTQPSAVPSRLRVTREPIMESSHSQSNEIDKPKVVSGCLCDDAGKCTKGSVKFGERFILCIGDVGDNFNVIEVIDVTLKDRFSSVNLISNSVPKREETMSTCSSSSCLIFAELPIFSGRSITATGIVSAYSRGENSQGEHETECEFSISFTATENYAIFDIPNVVVVMVIVGFCLAFVICFMICAVENSND